MKDPSIYKNTKKIDTHNKKYCTVINKEEIKKEINNLFKGTSPIYTKKVLIKTPSQDIETILYQRTDEEVITIKNEKISIDDILSIKRIS